MERSLNHPITDDEQQTIKAGSIDWNAVITSLQQTIEHDKVTRAYRDDRISELEDRVELLEKKLLEVGIKVDDDAHLVDDEEEDDWEDITYCHLTYTKKNDNVSTKLQMSGGGSHAWWYVLYWKSGEEEPEVYIETLNEVKHTKKTLILRQENGGSGRECQSVKLVDFDSELPRKNDEYHYHRFTITDDLYDATEEEEEDEICGQDGCDCVLCEDTPIMCYSNEEGDLTLCNNCYWDNEYWRDDQNEDNEDEIKDYICDKLRDDPNFVS